jgi:Flp pilus assembly protein TadG
MPVPSCGPVEQLHALTALSPKARPRRPNRRLRTPRRRQACHGAAAVEFALIAPLFFLLIFGMIEYGRMVMVQQVLTNGSREGARRAVLEQSTADEVQTLVSNYLANSSVSGATVTVSPADLSTVGFGDPVNVSVSVPFTQVSWVPKPWFLGSKTLHAQSVMNGERPE